MPIRAYETSRLEWPVVLLTLACAVVVCAYLHGCKLDTGSFGPGHRIDQPVVVVHTPSKSDDDGGKP